MPVLNDQLEHDPLRLFCHGITSLQSYFVHIAS